MKIGYELLGSQPKDKLGKKTLVLDLDNTLVHTVEGMTAPKNYDFMVQLPSHSTRRSKLVYVQVRPGFSNFYLTMSQYYEVVLYTASLTDLSDIIMDAIDPTKLCSKRLYRRHCSRFNHLFFMDLARLGRQMEDVILINNSQNSYLGQESNAVPMSFWQGNHKDDELEKLTSFLISMSKV